MGAIRNYTMVRDSNRHPQPDSVVAGGYVDCRVLAANTAESQAVPTGARLVLVTTTGNVFLNFSTTAAVPAADVSDGSAPTLVVSTQPRMFAINSATAISVISSAINTVTFEFFS